MHKLVGNSLSRSRSTLATVRVTPGYRPGMYVDFTQAFCFFGDKYSSQARVLKAPSGPSGRKERAPESTNFTVINSGVSPQGVPSIWRFRVLGSESAYIQASTDPWAALRGNPTVTPTPHGLPALPKRGWSAGGDISFFFLSVQTFFSLSAKCRRLIQNRTRKDRAVY